MATVSNPGLSWKVGEPMSGWMSDSTDWDWPTGKAEELRLFTPAANWSVWKSLNQNKNHMKYHSFDRLTADSDSPSWLMQYITVNYLFGNFTFSFIKLNWTPIGQRHFHHHRHLLSVCYSNTLNLTLTSIWSGRHIWPHPHIKGIMWILYRESRRTNLGAIEAFLFTICVYAKCINYFNFFIFAECLGVECPS